MDKDKVNSIAIEEMKRQREKELTVGDIKPAIYRKAALLLLNINQTMYQLQKYREDEKVLQNKQ